MSGYFDIIRYRPCAVMGLAALLLPIGSGSACAQTWVHETFEDFADGTLDAAGQNLYVARDGSVRAIHSFDLNGDGHLDLIFNNTHDLKYDVPATVAQVAADDDVTFDELATFASRAMVAADLNRDGHVDLAFCPDSDGIQTNRRLVRIAWGSAEGWTDRRLSTPLPVNQPIDLTEADLNADGWPDLIVLGQADADRANVARVFWGGREGFLLTRRTDMALPAHGLAVTSADFDGDGANDVAVLLNNQSIEIFWANASEPDDGYQLQRTVLSVPSGHHPSCLAIADGGVDLIAAGAEGIFYIAKTDARSWAQPQQVAAMPASHLATGDVDGDGWSDLVISYLNTQQAMGGEQSGASRGGSVHVLWGEAEGFDVEGRTTLDVDFARSAAVGDLNGDGRVDLAVAAYQGELSFAGESVIFFGGEDRSFTRAGTTVPTSGAKGVAIVPAEAGRAGRAVFANSVGGTLHEQIPLQIYWGDADGFKPDRQSHVPFASGYEASIADLNADGFADLIAMNSGHGGQAHNPTLGANIFWGSARGFDFDQPTVLREDHLASSNVADLNRDGHLDLILGGFGGSGGSGAELIVYYGTAEGYSREHREAVVLPGRSIGVVTGDFNRDDWLDIAVARYTHNAATILWGGPDGFDAAKVQHLPVTGCIEVEAADLNGDGWLDLLASSYNDPETGEHDMGTTIFWGGEAGFSPFNTQWLPGFTPLGLTVADFDGDGHLDYFSPHYHGNGTRATMPNYLYWGGPDGLAADRRTVLIADSPSDALAGDFNSDGRMDLAVICHSGAGNHATDSKVFLNDGNRFANPEVIDLPGHGPHWMYLQDMGHIADRSWRQSYTSPILNWDQSALAGSLTFEATTPGETSVTFQFRAAGDEQALQDAEWRDVPEGHFELAPADRCLQYRAMLESDNGSRYPVLEQVRIEFQN